MKCPCENCLLLGICKNQFKHKPTNFIYTVYYCKLLYDFLEVTDIYPPMITFYSNLTGENLDKRLEEVSKFIPRS